MDTALATSRLQHLMSTNDEPTEVEILHIRNHIEQSKAAFAKLNAQTAQAQAVLDSLRARTKDEESLLSRYCHTLAPIRRVPRDILIEIFLLTRDWSHEYPANYHPVGPRPGKLPLRITHVCSEWRRVALSVPELWSTIRICAQYSDPRAVQDNSKVLTWLQRTGAWAPLDIAYDGPNNLWTDDPKPLHISFAWMGPYVSRIRHLALSGCLRELPRGSFDVLETLEVRSVSLMGGSVYHSIINTTPMLRQVSFYGNLVRLHFVSWTQLTNLYLDLDGDSPIHQSVLLRIFSQCEALAMLFLSCRVTDEEDDLDDLYYGGYGVVESMSDQPILLSHLTSLTIGLRTDISWFLAHLTLPALSSLVIRSSMEGWSRSSYRSLMSRSSPPLQTLRLSGCWISNEAFLDLLRNTPSLMHVTARNCIYMTKTLADGMTWRSDDTTPAIGPNLQYMSFDSEPTPGRWADDNTIIRMISARHPSGPPVIASASNTLFSQLKVFRPQHPKDPFWATRFNEIEMGTPGRIVLHIFF